MPEHTSLQLYKSPQSICEMLLILSLADPVHRVRLSRDVISILRQVRLARCSLDLEGPRANS